MSRVRSLVALSLLVAPLLAPPVARGQVPDTTLWAQLRYRFVGPDGNRASAAVGEPGNPMVAYVGAASGGVWKTEDGGVHWRAVFDSEPAQAIGALAIAPSAHNVVWAGTGETFFIRPTTALGDGVYKSTDGGRSWRHMGLDPTGRIGRIVIDPLDPDVVLVCALGRGYGPAQERGVYRTADGGRTWTRVLFVDGNTGCSDLAMDPGDPQTIFAGLWQLEVKPWQLASGGSGSGLWVSRDGGVTWRRLAGHGLPLTTQAVGKIAVAVAPSAPNTIYALFEERDPTLYRSDDRGVTWRRVSRNHDMAERAPYYVRFTVAPDDPDRLYFVSVRFSESRDGGRTLTRVGFQAGGDNHDVWIDPLNPERMMIAHDGGASISLNRGQSWMRVVLPIAQMYHVATDVGVPYHLYGNRQDGGSYRMPSRPLGGAITEGDWGQVGGCESGFAVPDTVDERTVWSGCYDGGLEVYDARTDQARNVRVWPEAGYGWRPADVKYRWNWTFPIAISPHDHRRVYVGSQFVHVTTDGGASWSVISPDLTRNDTTHQRSSGGVTTDNLMTFDGATLFAIAESPVQAGVIWAGSNDGLVHVTRDGGSTWQDVTGAIPRLGPWGLITNIEPSRFDAGTAYLAVDRHQLDDLEPWIFRTRDFGRSWERISDSLPRGPLAFVHVVREDPARRGLLYAGTENGLYVTFDDGAHWRALQTNLPHAPVSWVDVQPHEHDLVVATHGRGFWILDDVSPLEQPGGGADAARLYAPRLAYRLRPRQGVSSAPNSAVRVDSVPAGVPLTYYVPPALVDTADTLTRTDSGPHFTPATLVILNAAGDTVRVLHGGRKPGLDRVWWDLRWRNPTAPRLRTPPPGASFVPVGADGTRPLVTWDLDLSERGPLVAPGTYTVRLAIGDSGGGATPAVALQQLRVVKDPNTDAGDSDVAAQERLALTIRGEQDSVARMINRLEWLRKQLGELTTQLKGDSTLARDSVARRLAVGADSLARQAVDVEGALFDVHLTGSREDAFRHPMQLWGRLAALQSDVSENGADFAPTTQQLAVNELLAGRIGEAAARLAQLWNQAVPAFRAALARAALPGVLAAQGASPSP